MIVSLTYLSFIKTYPRESINGYLAHFRRMKNIRFAPTLEVEIVKIMINRLEYNI